MITAMKKEKVYIVHSEYVQHGMTFNSKDRYIKDAEKADKIYEETLQAMINDNDWMVNDKDNYVIKKSTRSGNKWYCCSYKYQPSVSNFYVDIHSETLE